VVLAAAPPPTVVGHRAATTSDQHLPPEKMNVRGERRELLSRERIERERKEKMKVFIAYNIYICISNHLHKGVRLVMHARAFTPFDLGQTVSCGPYNTIPWSNPGRRIDQTVRIKYDFNPTDPPLDPWPVSILTEPNPFIYFLYTPMILSAPPCCILFYFAHFLSISLAFC